MWRLTIACFVGVGWAGAGAEPAGPRGEVLWPYRSTGTLAIDGSLVVALPAALPAGLARGVGLGVASGRRFAWGARAAWATATESARAWQVTHDDLRLRVTGAVQGAAGRGTIALRLGLGGTLVHESRVRHQGMRAGLSGDVLAPGAYAMLPAADLDLVVAVHVAGPWRFVLGAGPSVDVVEGRLRGGWSAQLGIGWQP